ncbi:hypothetical protein TNCT_158831 [Trichonephila clavata]|uniref:Uncharacterized protein n=1 Tax=Trichonephila clavata TaxID=2740835 RepID=A0A8X6GLK6_TRICU|nr:hypothetical protein TNCT_158831 [Trichonephila clavata]
MGPEWEFVGPGLGNLLEFSNSCSAPRVRPESGFWRRSRERCQKYIEIRVFFFFARVVKDSFSTISQKLFGIFQKTRTRSDGPKRAASNECQFESESRPQRSLNPFLRFFAFFPGVRTYRNLIFSTGYSHRGPIDASV